jgi:hypothetical protein
MKDGQGFARQVTSENLGQFAPLLGHKSESDSTESPDSQTTREKALLDPELQAAEALFSGNPIKISIPARFSQPRKVKKRRRLSRHDTREEIIVQPPIQVLDISRGQLVWRKNNLPASDVQRQRGAVTGGLRLTQAKFEVNGIRIDQTKYFRNVVLSQMPWGTGRKGFPKQRETVEITFDVTILGMNYGQHKLVVSHKPSGEAGQRNYTTMLHWGDLANTIKELNLVGKTFQLYGPPENQQEPFFIEIV